MPHKPFQPIPVKRPDEYRFEIFLDLRGELAKKAVDVQLKSGMKRAAFIRACVQYALDNMEGEMPDVNVTIRHARVGIHLVLSGALRDLEPEFGPEQQDECNAATSRLFNACVGEISDWDIPGTFDADLEACRDFVDSLRAWVGKPDCPLLVTELLTNHGLLR